MKIFITKGNFNAVGEYADGKVLVRKGSTINPSFAPYIKGISKAVQYRKDADYVDKKWSVIKDCEFSSPSTAAQFVMGQSRDGYDAWKVESGESLGKHLAANGQREWKRKQQIKKSKN